MDELINRYKKLFQPVAKTLSTAIDSAGYGIRGTADSINRVVSERIYGPQIQRSNQQLALGQQQLLQRARQALDPEQKRRLLSVAQDSSNLQAQNARFFNREFSKAPKDVIGESLHLGATVLGGPKAFSRQGLTMGGLSAGLGGGINAVTGGSVSEGIGRGIGSTPSILGITSLTNPLISRVTGNVANRFTGPLSANLASRATAGGLNVGEGAVIDQALNQPTTLGSAALDFGMGAILNRTSTGFDPRSTGQYATSRGVPKGFSPRINRIEPMDARDLMTALENIATKGLSPKLKRDGYKTIQNVLEAYAPGHRNVSQKRAVEIAEYLLERYRTQDINIPKIDLGVDTPLGQGLRESSGSLTDSPRSSVNQVSEAGMPSAKNTMKPITAYHGTDAVFDEFDMSRIGKNKANPASLGAWFTDSADYASFHGSNVMKRELSLSNPKVYERDEWQRMAKTTDFVKLREDLMKQGHDGVIVKGSKEKFAGQEVTNPANYAVFDVKQIKKVPRQANAISSVGTLHNIIPQTRVAQERVTDMGNLGAKGDYSFRVDDPQSPRFLSVTGKDGKTVGKLYLSRDQVGGRNMLHIDGVEVDPSARGQGLATELLRKAEDVIKRAGYDGIIARHETIKNKREIPHIFNKLGYQDIGEGTGLGKYVAQQQINDTSARSLVDPKVFDELDEAGGGTLQGGLGLVEGGSFKQPYKPGDIKKLESMRSEILGDKSTRSAGNISMEDELRDAAARGDEQAQGLVTALDMIDNEIDAARSARTAPASPPATPPGSKPVKVQKTPKYAGSINTERLQVESPAKVRIVKQIESIKPQLERAKGAPLTLDEVTQAAETSKVMQKVVTREQSKNMEASILKARQRLVTLDAEINRAVQSGNTAQAERLTNELIRLIKVVDSQAADAGRKLGSFRINAAEKPFRDQIIEQITKRTELTEQQVAELSARIARTDFNDARQVTALYREYIKPTFSEMLDEYRYMNLLSSPRTHIVNAFSNAIQASVLNPATKLASGTVDLVASSMTGKNREHYIAEVPLYYRGSLNAVPKAFSSALDALKGKENITNLDMNRVPTGSVISKVNYITRALEAGDRFWRTIIEGGEAESLGYKFRKSGAEASTDDIAQLAKQKGEYFVFRQGLDTANVTGQGKLLSTVDKGTEWVMRGRQIPVLKWFVPFVQTPMNIFKQGIEYSPAGFGTVPGAADKSEQIGKALIGSTVFAGAGYLALQDRLTWAAPKDPEQKKAFYAAGMQPYAVKIGDKWVSFSKVGPLAYPLAMAAAFKYSFEDNPNAVTEDTIDKMGNAITGIGGFFADQSYMQGIGDMINALEGQEGYTNKFATTAGNLVGQVVPLSSLQRWVAQVIDPIYRKPENLTERLAKDIPGLSDSVGYYENPLGEPSQRQFPELNAFSPLGVTQENPSFKGLYDLRQQELEANSLIRAEEKRLEQEDVAKANQVGAAGEVSDQNALIAAKRAEVEEKLARKRVELQGGVETIGSKIIYKDSDGDTATLDLSKFDSAPQGFEKYTRQQEAITAARKVFSIPGLSEEEKQVYYDKLGVKAPDVQYDYAANLDSTAKAQFFADQSSNHDQLIALLRQGRRESLSGDRIANDKTLDLLADEGLISTAEAKALKKLDLGKDGKTKAAGGSGRKAKVVKLAVPKAKKVGSGSRRLKIIRRDYKLKPVKLGTTRSSALTRS